MPTLKTALWKVWPNKADILNYANHHNGLKKPKGHTQYLCH